ncbi:MULTISPECIES: sensor histidine kinase KdpD [Asticcacaulis]|uniref:sensor histidine kinase n=1 Tax=Asticcacaulis TaxID=76890 RepID=UPI001AE889BC|nr:MULTISPECIES: HAMP domain-containing sensor histidine kinase [Asticcacaulis]MBP2157824.1 signal transduction histidine kinase [Asticcacaulis solisilvae]MDR6798869.1 signal transduction histidine kinase [Asticcacaulis sp. BE141]
MATAPQTSQARDTVAPWQPATAANGDDNAARRAFLRMVSHELRTPLNSIIGFSEILHQQLYGPLGSPNYVEYAGIIQDSGKKLLALFNSFIEIVRLEGGGDLKPQPNAVLAAFEDAVAKVRGVASARGVHLDIRLLDENLEAWFDPRGLASCLDQLLHNAMDFTAPGDSIELDAAIRGGMVELSVFNRGDAPPAADIDRLMAPFEQGSSSAARTRQGAGLGWAIVRLNAQAMGGTFEVESFEGQSLRAILRLKAA